MTTIKPELILDKDADLALIQSRKICIIGYGNQGRAQAMNLRDSGCNVRIGARVDGTSWKLAEEDGFGVETIRNAAQWSDVIVLLLPDQVLASVYQTDISAGVAEKNTLIFAHGYNIHYGYIRPQSRLDVVMVAPSGPGKAVRETYTSGSGIPNLIAVHQNTTGQAWDLALSYARAIGGTRVGAFRSTFKEEVETDLFGEQALLTGGIPQLIRAAFRTLLDAGYQPAVAWFVCFYEVKAMMEMLHEKGFAYVNQAISDTAEYGGYTRGRQIIDEHVERNLKVVLEDVRQGKFALEWQTESESDFPLLNSLRTAERGELIEEITRLMLSQLDRG